MSIKLDSLLSKPVASKKDREIVLLSEEKSSGNIIEPDVPETDEDIEKIAMFLAKVDQARNAASGIKKIIEQTQEKAIIPVEKEVQRAIKSSLGIDSDVITFEIYQKAIALREELFMSKLRKKLLDEQIEQS